MTPTSILVVDADASHCRSLAEILRNAGYDVLTSPDGTSGWRTFLMKRPDFVLLDLLLPDMSGIELAEKITKHEENGTRVLIILMTDLTLDSEGMIEPLKRGGISVTLSKPVAPDAVLEALSGQKAGLPDSAPQLEIHPAWTSQGDDPSPEVPPPDIDFPPLDADDDPAPAPPEIAPAVFEPDVFFANPASTPSPSPRRVLLADDNPVTRQIFRRAFNSGEFLVETAANGEEALRLLEGEPPDIILLDVNLPGKNGFDLLDVIRGNDALSGAAVAFLREPFEKTDERRLKDSPVDGLIQKPLKSAEWVGRVKDLLEVKAGRPNRR